jgi:preprotein translocase subunit SecD
MNIKKSIKQYWRIYLLIIVTIISLSIIFSPAIPGLDLGEAQATTNENPTWDQKYTSLKYSIELAGGTRIRAPLIGATAEGANFGIQDTDELEVKIAEDFEEASQRDIQITEMDTEENTGYYVEVTSEDADRDVLQNSLDKNNIEYESVRDGVTPSTRDAAVNVLQNKIDEAGLSGGSVRVVELSDGSEFILISVPDVDRQGTIDLIENRGSVNIDVYHDNNNDGNYTQETVLTTADFRTVGTANQGDGRQPSHVPVVLTPESAQGFQQAAVESGVARSGGSRCSYDTEPESTDSCLLTVVDGDVVYSAGMSPSLASSMRSGSWAEDPNFILQTGNYSEAQSLAINLRAGVMPATLDIGAGEISFVSAQQGDKFKIGAFLIGILATITVATNIFLIYGKVKIAAPMLITAGAEVIILLAISSLVSYPIDVAVIAGFVAVIGTGVDDLIIIADQVMGGENPATSDKIFERRFRKALWIILGAAGTTILALGPLAVLQLNELQGFAIFTIIGVIVGVVLTRPAYGDMLRYLFTDR